ncbi:DUF4886 domain-containing protein [Chitinophaga barathri]|uniref:DUF4886 domain-containing protein n=1 Tax=Chitinophaga barathri TaxID=1647451 RepID=A0A3N4MDD6_9BACT|nr:DUF4886 domain-containing protein [Chitinophaga barathri]RPD39587.1 DUF4886 domain-containing protein [Chitinophaga barathri]
MLSKFRTSLFILLSICITVQAQGGKKIRLFIIGNSFSQNAASFLPQLAKEGGMELELGRAELGGCSLERHWKLAESGEKAYKGKSLREMLSNGRWDIVTIQQYSLLSGDPDTYEPYARKLVELIRSLQPGAKIFIHQVWAYRNDAEAFGKINGNERAKNAEEMHRHVRAAYHKAAAELGLTVIPTGDAFRAMDSSLKWHYSKDTAYNFNTPQAGQLPNQANSLHVGYIWRDGKLAFDANHANTAGCYLGSLVWYRTLLGGKVKKVKFKPGTVSAPMAKEFKQVVAAL